MSDFLTEKSMEITQAPSSLLTYNKIESKIAFDQAARDGNRVVLPEPHQLLIDIDNEQAYETFISQFNRFVELIEEGAEIIYDELSKSGVEGHRHIIINLPYVLENEKRILFQLMLGSDLRRELLSYVRELEGDEHPTLFIEKPAMLLLPPAPTPELTLEILTDADCPF